MLRALLAAGHTDLGISSNIAKLYSEGLGVRPSRSQALRWTKRAWRKGSQIAPLNFAIDEANAGRTRSALKWFRRAIALGNIDALFRLAKFYLNLERDHDKAAALLRLRVSAGPQISFTVSEGTEPIETAKMKNSKNHSGFFKRSSEPKLVATR